MASTSTSYKDKNFKYDVFLSFRGEDTRKSFVDHLFHALKQKSIHTYKDDERITKGKRITDDLIKSIEESKFYIIIFSKKYASSSWCLEELVKIMECHKATDEHRAYPVFFDVEPTEVRKQSGAVGEAFAKHEKEEDAAKWRDALKEAADLAGWELKNTTDGHEAKFIQKIVEEVSLELRSINYVDENLVGMKNRVKDVVQFLGIGLDDVRMIGIKGMGGGGKTTLARSLFDHISTEFEAKSFVENVKEVSKASLSGLKKLQKQILLDVLNEHVNLSSVHDGKNMMKRRMCGIKVLIVLDDVDKIEQLAALAGERSWFKPGSRIIITTRDAQVLIAHKVNLIRDVNLLTDKEAICLFSRHAFGRDIPIEGYKELSEQVVRYAAGLPLTIVVLGSFLCGKDDLDWKDALERLKSIPLKETLEQLEISYIGLEEDYKEIFLDVACMLKGLDKGEAMRALESRGLHARNGLRVLELKSLITISEYNCLDMHDHIQEMGRNIVRRLHPHEPNRHSRLWISKEIEYILANNLGTQETQCTRLQIKKYNAEVMVKGLRNMKGLRFLDAFYEPSNYASFDQYNVHPPSEFGKCLPNGLRFLRCHFYPFRTLPNTFQANNLVGLHMNRSNMRQLWEDGEDKVLYNLRFLEFESSKLSTLDLRLAPNLEKLCLSRCADLVELRMPIRNLKLISAVLSHLKLRTLDLGITPNLEMLSLVECDDLVELEIPESLKLVSLNLYHSKLRTLHLGNTPNLEELILEESYDLVELHMRAECLKLISLDLSYKKLRILDLRNTRNLKTLCLRYCHDLVELHVPSECRELVSLEISHSKLTTLQLGIAPNLETLSLYCCRDLVGLHIPIESLNLRSLNLSCSKLRTLNLGLTTKLETLTLKECNYLEELLMPTKCLNLTSLKLTHSKLTTLHLGITPNLETLSLYHSRNLVGLHIPAECPKLRSLNLSCSKLRTVDLGLTPNLERLDLEECYDLVEINAPTGCLKKLVCFNLRDGRINSFLLERKIHRSSPELYFSVTPKGIYTVSGYSFPRFEFTCLYREHPTSLFGNFEKLISVGFCAHNPENFLVSICGLRSLRRLSLVGWSIRKVPKHLDQLECLEELSLWSTDIKYLPDSICTLKHLKSLKIKDSWFLEKLPDDLGRLEYLEKLTINDCKVLREIPNSVCDMKRLKTLDLTDCIRVEKLPKDTGHLECLKELEIRGTGISDPLPQSIQLLKGLPINPQSPSGSSPHVFSNLMLATMSLTKSYISRGDDDDDDDDDDDEDDDDDDDDDDDGAGDVDDDDVVEDDDDDDVDKTIAFASSLNDLG